MKQENIDKIKEQAIKEIEEEEFRRAVAIYKQKLREVNFWDKVFPFKIVVIRKDRP